MLISLNWLKQYVDIQENTKELEQALTMIGQEVENIDIQGENLGNVVIGQIVEFDKHPNSDKLSLLKVDIGENEPLQIVCGAKNHKLGDKVVVATIGAVLPGDFKIKKSKIRDVESFGMLCSEIELGLGESADGIIILPEDAPIGKEYREYIDLNDVIFDLEITPNRPDCLSYLGIAREIGAYYGKKIKNPIVNFAETIEPTSAVIKVDVQDKNRCKRYMGRVIKNVKVEESPNWLKQKIRVMGLKPINNIVDITNFVMFEYNQPMHAFDFDKIEESSVIVRSAKEGETIITLDGEERKLTDELIIADAVKPIAIAGIIGGSDTQVTSDTKNIFLEVAYFEPTNIRKTGRNLGIITESSYRNERGMDIERVGLACDRALSLIEEIAGGEILDAPIDRYTDRPEVHEITLNLNKLNKFVGKEIPADIVGNILTSLGLEIKTLTQDTLVVIPPTYRDDLRRTADIYEEVIRMYGFDKIEPVTPIENIQAGVVAPDITITNEVKALISQNGLQEVINYSFIPSKVMNILDIKEPIIEIKNPLSEDMAILRPTLIWSVLNNIKDNLNRNQFNLRLGEVSKVFYKSDKLADEELKVCIGLAGHPDRDIWNAHPKSYDFYDLKGYMEIILAGYGITKYKLTRSSDPNFHPGRSADIMIGNDKIGTFGEIHPEVAEKMDIKRERAYIGELNLTRAQKYRKIGIKYEDIVKYPEVSRDLAIVIDKDILVGDMIDKIKKSSNLIENVEIFDIYEGDKIEENKKSVALGITLRDKKKTLDEKQITDTINKTLTLISKEFGGELRK